MSQVNVDSRLFPSVVLLFFFFFVLLCFVFSFFHLLELCLLILCPGRPEINPELKDQLVTYNSPLEFKCSLGGVPTPEIRWTKDGLNISNNNILRIRQAKLEDSGKYTCRANNSEGSKNATFWIEVTGTVRFSFTYKKDKNKI